MPVQNYLKRLDSLSSWIQQLERRLTQRANILTFLVVRFVLMSGMVVGFSWVALKFSP